MKSKSKRSRTSGGEAPSKAGTRRGQENKADGDTGDLAHDQIVQIAGQTAGKTAYKTTGNARGKIAGKTNRMPGDKAGYSIGEKTGEKIPPSMIHTVARDVLLPYQVR
jgi:hypothetical protein